MKIQIKTQESKKNQITKILKRKFWFVINQSLKSNYL